MIGIYTRLSVEDDISTSIENQINEGKVFAKNRKYEIYNEGEGISGRADIKDRPVLDKLMRDIATDKINIVWFRNQNRLERNSETFIAFSSLAKRKKIEVYFNDKQMDWNDPTNYLQSSILTAINSYQAELQSYQTKKVLLNRVLEGKAHGKSTPLGYTKDDEGYLIINNEEKPIVEKIYEMCLEGNGSTTIKHWLNDNNIPTRYSKRDGTFKIKNANTGKITHKKKSDVIWSDKQVQDILKNPMYKGKRRWKDKLIDCPKIFNEFYWEKVQVQYEKNKDSNNTGKKVDHLYLLKGLLECGECGRNYYGRTRISKKDNYYMCSSKRYKQEKCTNRSINIDVLESFVWTTIFENRTIFQKVQTAFKDGGLDKKKVELENKIKDYQKTLKALDKEYKKSIDLVVRGVVEESDITETKNRVVRETNKINEHLTNDENELKSLVNETFILTQIKHDLDFGVQTGIDWGIINEIVGNGQFEDITDLKRRKLAKDRYDQLNKDVIDNREKSAIVEHTPYNKKKEVLTKYLKRIYIQYDKESKIYTLKIDYDLPIEDESYYIDSNYIAAYAPQQQKIVDWHFIGRHFTNEKIEDTYNQLKNYVSN
ncbi:DNA invertase Pin-like site-specific DNA recombinase [Maribacter spongiicola]|uniref:DNA invertase Pin-like site-specific DNA recombinase n=1 Tax=Maribacter spongiicola TaxID=1206753 RepID=A0A4R7K2U3_9FLAO|nr:recombinase family protein [Maribacter spongiicola]TDT44955.1 DNA invertase Pin-like site-specific DNA recombinase [Maribacter spongiicola]